VIPPDEIAGYVRKYHQIYCGLANAGDWWFDFKPWKIGEIQAEKNAVAKIEGLIILVTHPSPNKENIKNFYKNNG
jgi:hypothetical protein